MYYIAWWFTGGKLGWRSVCILDELLAWLVQCSAVHAQWISCWQKLQLLVQ